MTNMLFFTKQKYILRFVFVVAFAILFVFAPRVFAQTTPTLTMDGTNIDARTSILCRSNFSNSWMEHGTSSGTVNSGGGSVIGSGGGYTGNPADFGFCSWYKTGNFSGIYSSGTTVYIRVCLGGYWVPPTGSPPGNTSCSPVSSIVYQPSAPPLTISTASPTGVTATSANMRYYVTSPGQTPTTATIFWGPRLGPTCNSTTDIPNNGGSNSVTGSGYGQRSISGLSPSTTYCYRVSASDSAGQNRNGVYREFTTQVGGPPTLSITTNNASGVSTNAATINYNLTATGQTPTTVTMRYGVKSGSCDAGDTNITAPGSPRSDNSTGPGGFAISGLSPSTTYCFRAQANDSAGQTAYGNFLQFVTNSPPPLSVTTHTHSQTGSRQYRLYGILNSNGQGTVTRRIRYATNGSMSGASHVSPNPTSSSFNGLTANNLTQGRAYYYQAYATDGIGQSSYGSVKSFTVPLPAAPNASLSLSGINWRTPSASTARATLTSQGVAPTSLSFQYQDPIGASWVTGNSGGSYSVGQSRTWNIASLMTPGNSFRIRACATDSAFGGARTGCSPYQTIYVPSGTLTLATMTSCFPQPSSGDDMQLRHTYAGSSTFADCVLLENGGNAQSVPTPTATFVDSSNPGSATTYETRCRTPQNGYLYSNPQDISGTCGNDDNLTLAHAPSCTYMDASFHNSPTNQTGTITWQSVNGVDYDWCSASASLGDSNNVFSFSNSAPHAPTRVSPTRQATNFKIPFFWPKNASDVTQLNLTCQRSFDGIYDTQVAPAAPSAGYDTCSYPEPEFTFAVDPQSVSVNNPRSTISWTTTHVESCDIRGYAEHDGNQVFDAGMVTRTPDADGANRINDGSTVSSGSATIDFEVTTQVRFNCVPTYPEFAGPASQATVDICFENSNGDCELSLVPRIIEI